MKISRDIKHPMSSLTRISDISSNPITQLYERLGAQYMYGNFPIFETYSDNLRLPTMSLRFKSVNEAVEAMKRERQLTPNNAAMLQDWLLHGQPIACLVPYELKRHIEDPDQPGLKLTEPINSIAADVEIIKEQYELKPIPLKRTATVYNIEGRTYKKYPTAPAEVYIALSEVQL